MDFLDGNASPSADRARRTRRRSWAGPSDSDTGGVQDYAHNLAECLEGIKAALESAREELTKKSGSKFTSINQT